MTAAGRALRLAGRRLLDLERAQPPGLPAAAVELQRHAGLAAHLPRPLPGRLRRPAGASGLAHPKVLFGETAPTGYDTVNRHREGSRALLHDVAPLAFLREALCLNAHYGAIRLLRQAADQRLRAPRLHEGREPALRSAPKRDDVTIGVALAALARARPGAHAHAIPSHLPIYLTEFGVQSMPNQRTRRARSPSRPNTTRSPNTSRGRTPRVAAFSQYLLKDDPLGGEPGSSVARRHGRLPDGPRVRQRQAQAAVLRPGRCR